MAKHGLVLASLLMIGLLSFGMVLAQDATEEITPEATPEINLENVTADHESYYGQEVTLTGVVEEFVNVRAFVLGENAAIDDDRVLVINNTDREFYLWVHKGLDVSVTGVVYPSINQGGLGQIVMASSLPATREAMSPGLASATLEPAMTLESDISATMPTLESELMPTEEMSGGAMATLQAPSLDSATEAVESGDMSATEDMGGAMATMEATMPMADAMTPTPLPSPTDMPTEPEIDFSTMGLPEEYNDYTIIVISSVDSVIYVGPEAE